MAWADVPAKVAKLDGLKYADSSAGTSASSKIVKRHTDVEGSTSLDDVPAFKQAALEADLDYHIEACENLGNSKALPIDQLRQI